MESVVSRGASNENNQEEASRWCVVVHGGAGNVSPARRPLHAEGCRRAARAGSEVLKAGGTSLDAVVAAVRVLEDDPIFNAGIGASLNAEGHIELDASIMEGRDLRAGAICALPPFLEPIAIARAVLEEGKHVLYTGEGAARFARQKGFKDVPEATMITDAARDALERVRAGAGSGNWAGNTVGAVARDASGTCACATSTGGMVNKAVGRIGDAPLIGAGGYADDEAGAVSTTGEGEGMIRLGTARMAVERMRAGESAERAAHESIQRLFTRLRSVGGLIAIDARGRWGIARCTPSMSWAVVLEAKGEIREDSDC